MNLASHKILGPLEGPFLFIVNPNSGTGAVNTFRKVITQFNAANNFTVIESQSPAHSLKLAHEAGSNGYEAVIAVGGDGSVHEIGAQLIGTTVALGIIPTGSGNGVSRHLGISNTIPKAIEQMLKGKVRPIDTFIVNNQPAIGFAGVGIDAHVAKMFSEASERGFSNYVKLSIDAFTNYKHTAFNFNADGNSESTSAFSLVCANTSQFGNNAFINPQADDDDGFLELVIIKNMPPAMLVPVASRLFLKSIHKSKWVSTLKVKRIEIENLGDAQLQINGEALGVFKNLTFEVRPKSLMVLIP